MLDLLHPSGSAGDVSIVGSRTSSPVIWEPADRTSADGDMSDAILVFPDDTECGSRSWLQDAAAAVARRLAPDGVAYVVLPPRSRRRFLRLVHRHGLVLAGANMHVRSGSSSYYAIPCDARVAAHALQTMPVRAATRHLASLVAIAAVPDIVLQSTWTDVGMVVRRPNARPLFDWTRAITPAAGVRTAIIRTKRRGDLTTAVLTLFERRSGLPLSTLKVPVSRASEAARRREAAMIESLEPAAARAGASLPSAEVVSLRHGRWLLCSHVLPGMSAAAMLASSPHRLPRVVANLGAWLARWSALTQRPACADAARLEREILQPARMLASRIPGGEEYLSWLQCACERFTGVPMPFVATHNDLTMSNILLSDCDSQLGVLDWESASVDGLPLVDFFYAAADARAAAAGYRDRTAAFIETFDERAPYACFVRDLAARLCEAVRLPQQTAILLRHASALQHAVDEHRERRPGPQPFLEMVRWMWRTDAQRAAA